VNDTTEHTQKTPSFGTGLLATLLAFLRRQGRGARSSTLRSAAAAQTAALLGAAAFCALLLAAPAQAASFGEYGTGAGQILTPNGTAVDQSSGDIYVLDGTSQRVDEFGPSGAFIRAFGWGVATGAAEPQSCTATCQQGLPGPGPGQFSYSEAGIAVGPGGDIYVLDGTGPGGDHRVQKFDSSGNFILTFGGEVNKTKVAQREEEEANSEPITVTAAEEDLCTAASGDTCGAGTPGTAPGQFGAFPEGAHVAIGPAGAVYVADSDRVQRFEADGSFAAQVAIPLARPITQLAVDPAGNLYVREENINPNSGENEGEEVPPIHEYDPSGTLLRTLDASGHPRAFTVDAAGNLFVRDQTFIKNGSLEPSSDTALLEYDSSGAQTEFFPLPAGSPTLFPLNAAVAYGETAKLLYLTNFLRGFPDRSEILSVPLPPPGPLLQPASSTQATDVLATTATLQASLNPEGKATTFHFDYISEEKYDQDGESFGAGTEETPESASLGADFSEHPAASHLSGLQPQTTYRYRVVAHNSNGTITGPALTFVTLPPVLFSIQSPTALTTTSATLHAYLDPLGPATTYRFEYGPTTAYGESSAELSAGAEDAFALQSAAISNLTPGTEYHFRVLATNSLGTAESPDFAFTTLPTSCPNQELRTEDNSSALPDCRAYEMVSPPFKAATEVTHDSSLGIAPSGERVLYKAGGSFAGDLSGSEPVTYLARRAAAGWLTESISPPPSLGRTGIAIPAGSNPEFTEFLTTPLVLGSTSESQTQRAPGGSLYLRRPDGSFIAATPLLTTTDASSLSTAFDRASHNLVQTSLDLSKVVFGIGEVDSPALLSWEPKSTRHVYEVTGVGTPSPQLHVLNREDGVGESNEIPACVGPQPMVLGGQDEGPIRGSHAHEISTDGSKVFFEVESPILPGGCGARHLLARIDGQHTLDLADPSDPAGEPWVNEACTTELCQSAGLTKPIFQGASADGSKVFFSSKQPLTDDASPLSRNLYEYDFDAPPGHNLIDLSRGTDPAVGQVVGSSEDGSLLYFFARGLLTDVPNALGQRAETGAENLYLIDTASGKLTFISSACSGSEESGTLHDVSLCPGSGADSLLAGHEGEPYDLTPDGLFLVFTTYAQLTPDDQNQAADVYRYDARTGSLLRVSVGHDGEDQNGNGGGQDAIALGNAFGYVGHSLAGHNHILSADGATVLFLTARPLQASAENGLVYGYEWHQGQVTLIAGGIANSNFNERELSLSPSGKDILFVTRQGLLAPDTDGLGDLYDARIEGGFPLSEPEKVPCEGNGACHESGTGQSLFPNFTTEQNRHGPEPLEKKCKKGFVKRHSHCVKVRKHHKKRHHVRSHKRAASHKRGGGK
jgi:YD repeat-containing protein